MTTFTTEDREQAEKPKSFRSFWNHRVVRMPDDGLGGEWLEIQEVYYNDKDEPCGYCDPCLGGESVEEAKTVYERLAEAFTKPVLDSSKDFNNKFNEDEEDGKEI